MNLIWPSLIIVQMVPVFYICRSYRLKIDFRVESLDICYVASPSGPLQSLFKVCPYPQGQMFNVGSYRIHEKNI